MFSRRISLVSIVIAFFCASFFSTTLFIPHTLAASDPISITTQTATETFPKGIDFQVTVQDTASAISQATLILSSNKPRYMEVERDVAVTTPQRALTLTWHEDTSGSNFVYPGTPINYKWQFHDNANHWHTQDQHTITVIDNRFDWQNLTQGQVEVHWYGQAADFGQIVLSQAIDNVKRISNNLGGSLLHPINLWVYQTSNDFHGSLPPDVHEWVGGIAFPPLNEASIVVDSPNAATLVRDMPHELTHLVFHQLTEQGVLAPLWFDEGLAVYNQSYHEPEMLQSFKQALATHALLRLSEISYNFPANANTAYLAYAQSWNLIGYMYTTFGQTKMATLISLMNGKQNEFNNDLKQALGEDQIHLENQWRVQLNQSSVLTAADMPQSTPQSSGNTLTNPVTSDTITPLLVLLGLLLIILPLVGVSGAFVYQRRKRQREIALQEAQRILSSTFPPYVSRSLYQQPYQQYPQPTQQSQQQRPTMPFESYGDMTIAPIPYNDSPLPYTDPRHYQAHQEHTPQPPGQEYMSQPPPKQAPQD